MGSTNRLARMNQSNNMGSNSHVNTNYSVISEDNQESVAVLWGTNFDVREVENKIKIFVNTFKVLELYKLDCPNSSPRNG